MAGREKKENKKKIKNTIRTGGAAHLVLFTPGAGLGKLNKHVLPRPQTTCCTLQPDHVILLIIPMKPGVLTSLRQNHAQSKKLGLKSVQQNCF